MSGGSFGGFFGRSVVTKRARRGRVMGSLASFVVLVLAAVLTLGDRVTAIVGRRRLATFDALGRLIGLGTLGWLALAFTYERVFAWSFVGIALLVLSFIAYGLIESVSLIVSSLVPIAHVHMRSLPCDGCKMLVKPSDLHYSVIDPAAVAFGHRECLPEGYPLRN